VYPLPTLRDGNVVEENDAERATLLLINSLPIVHQKNVRIVIPLLQEMKKCKSFGVEFRFVSILRKPVEIWS
jgi:hypothetical protein